MRRDTTTRKSGVSNSKMCDTLQLVVETCTLSVKDEPLWKEEAPPAQNIHLRKAVLALRTDEKDPAEDR